ncbi:MAG: hypothetical protein AMXMBFR33_55750 [Candidatus Xenobia bacterium]
MSDIVVDANILIYARVSDFPEHESARRALEAALVDATGRVVLTVGILHEVLHILTDGRRFGNPMSMADGIDFIRTYLGRTNIAVLPTQEVDLENALSLVEQFRLGRGRISDALLAATARRYGIRRLMTHNVRDFAVFPFLEVIDPIVPTAG